MNVLRDRLRFRRRRRWKYDSVAALHFAGFIFGESNEREQEQDKERGNFHFTILHRRTPGGSRSAPAWPEWSHVRPCFCKTKTNPVRFKCLVCPADSDGRRNTSLID